MQQAIIYSPAKTAMQSGTAKIGQWVLEFKQLQAKHNDPLMGWIGGSETTTQIKLTFDTLEQAKEYAQKQQIPFIVRKPKKPRALKTKAYADNYAFNKRETWTH
ncbi:MAG: hypothetical protein ACJARD_000982 [Alphaproteobacteria bacterium]|jgi:hypothetical protein